MLDRNIVGYRDIIIMPISGSEGRIVDESTPSLYPSDQQHRDVFEGLEVPSILEDCNCEISETDLLNVENWATSVQINARVLIIYNDEIEEMSIGEPVLLFDWTKNERLLQIFSGFSIRQGIINQAYSESRRIGSIQTTCWALIQPFS